MLRREPIPIFLERRDREWIMIQGMRFDKNLTDGRHNGKTLASVAKSDPKHLVYLLVVMNLSLNERQIIKGALR